MVNSNFGDDRRFCSSCATYVAFLVSPVAAYCASCGDHVALFSPEDMSRFRAGAKQARAPFQLPGTRVPARRGKRVTRAATG